jgi:hypothetical protein
MTGEDYGEGWWRGRFGGEGVEPCASFGGLLEVHAIGVQHWVIIQ